MSKAVSKSKMGAGASMRLHKYVFRRAHCNERKSPSKDLVSYHFGGSRALGEPDLNRN
jgi:hypothetical protein